MCYVKLIVPRKCEREGLDLPDEDFCRKLRPEMGAIHQAVVGIAMARADRCASAQSDESPLDQRSAQTTQLQADTVMPDGSTKRERFNGTGAYEIHDKSAEGEARAVQEQVFAPLAAAVAQVRADLVKKHGERVADSLIDSKKGGVTLRKLVGAVLASDNAAGAVKSSRELMKIVAALVKEEMGDEWGKHSADAQRGLVKMWCVGGAWRWRGPWRWRGL